MKNKKTVMSISALLILIFHLWMNTTTFIEESYIRQLCVIGVDLFFFVSIYSIGKRKKIDYIDFINNRFIMVYSKFIVFTIAFAIMSSWTLDKTLLTIFGFDLFVSGGGSFLWFIPGIMIIYLLIPIFMKCDSRNSRLTFVITLITFILFEVLVSTFTEYREIFILTNRIPMMLIAYYSAKYSVVDKLLKKKSLYWIITILLLVIGSIISLNTVIYKVNSKYIYDVFYILHIPFELGIILLIDRIKDNVISNVIGKSTLEIYALQMMFGFKFANNIYMKTNNALFTNILVIIIIISISIIIKYSCGYLVARFSEMLNKK